MGLSADCEGALHCILCPFDFVGSQGPRFAVTVCMGLVKLIHTLCRSHSSHTLLDVAHPCYACNCQLASCSLCFMQDRPKQVAGTYAVCRTGHDMWLSQHHILVEFAASQSHVHVQGVSLHAVGLRLEHAAAKL